MPRFQDRPADQLRPVRITRGFTRHAEGSVLVEFGETRVLCTASVEEKVPGFLKGKGSGWVTAEYGMLPRATHTRGAREAASGKQSGRTQEIQRLVGRAPEGEIEQAVELATVEGCALGGALHLDEQATTGDDDVHVGLGARVLGVGQVEHRLAVDDADADCGD